MRKPTFSELIRAQAAAQKCGNTVRAKKLAKIIKKDYPAGSWNNLP